MGILSDNPRIGASGAGGDYEIEQSLRFDEGRETRLTRTPTSNGNAKTWTWSAWVKRSELSNAAQSTLFAAGVYNGSSTHLHFAGDNTLHFYQYDSSYIFREESTQVFRDTSAWYNIVAVVDTTNGTAADRIKLYVNGVQITSFANVLNPNQNQNTYMNLTANKNYIGDFDRSGDGDEFGGYLGEVNFIDGQALTPDSFGETGTYGEWNPIEYAGTYGTNGFYLPFKQDYTVEGFSTVVYEANTQVRYIGGVGFQPDFLWFKNRTRSGTPHRLVDTLRGLPKTLSTNTTIVEATGLSDGTVNRLVTGVTADGFTLGIDDGGYRINSVSGDDIVAWTWDMGGTTASNTDGTITTSVRANTTYGQSIVSWTGNATNTTKLGHGLDSTPEIVIVKSRTTAAPWKVGGSVIQAVYGDGSNNSAFLSLNTTAAADQETTGFQGNTATTIGVGANSDTNSNGATYIAYAFHSVTGYSKFSSYSGNGSTTGPVITLGFSPAFVMIKRSNAAEHWKMYDNVRNPFNPVNTIVNADETDAEATSVNNTLNFTATGFQCTSTNGATNASGGKYIYMAFADTREYAYWLDQSGNNNDWESEGGLTESDVMVDSPTNNFAVCNPLTDSGNRSVKSEGNLRSTAAYAGWEHSPSSISMSAGKWYSEMLLNTAGEGIAIYACVTDATDTTAINYDSNNKLVGYKRQSGDKVINGTVSSYGAGYNAGDIIGMALDMDAKTLTFYKNNASQGTISSIPYVNAYFDAVVTDDASVTFNFGQDSSFAGKKTPQGYQDASSVGDFFYQPPSGFLALCTKSLPSVDVIPTDNFNTVLYTGNGGNQSITTGLPADFVWVKSRSTAAYYHTLFDTVRGTLKRIFSNTNGAEDTEANTLTAFNSDGFTLGSQAGQNASNVTYVAWNWKAGGSASSNSNGSITSQVSANAAAGFSIVSYTGTGSNATVGHGLSKAPNMSWIKPRNFADNWIVTYDAVDGSDDQIYLNLTNAGESPASQYAVAQNATTLGLTGWNNVNDANDTYVAYCFHSVDGYSKVGSYVGNGNADGPFVSCGFKPAFVLIKRSNAAQDWYLWDNKTSPINAVVATLSPNSSGAEDDRSSLPTDLLSNGFKIRNTSIGWNGSGDTYIFIAFAESPFKNSNAR